MLSTLGGNYWKRLELEAKIKKIAKRIPRNIPIPCTYRYIDLEYLFEKQSSMYFKIYF